MRDAVTHLANHIKAVEEAIRGTIQCEGGGCCRICVDDAELQLRFRAVQIPGASPRRDINSCWQMYWGESFPPSSALVAPPPTAALLEHVDVAAQPSASEPSSAVATAFLINLITEPGYCAP